MPPEPRPRPLEQVRFYVDEDILGIGYAMMWLRPDAITCGVEAIADRFPRQIPDTAWIPQAAERGWVAVTAHRKIRSNPLEAGVAVSCSARIVCLAGSAGNRTSWDKMALLARHWTAVENQIKRAPDGPWWLAVSTSGTYTQPYVTQSQAAP